VEARVLRKEHIIMGTSGTVLDSGGQKATCIKLLSLTLSLWK